jgi:hypothetical protein
MRLSRSKDSYWTYGLRIGGSASYTTLLTVNGQKNSTWNALGDLRLRALYNRSKAFWLTEIYTRENMQWLSEDNRESRWSVAQDMLQFQSSLVYRFFDWIGPYARVNAKTHIFPEYHWFDNTDTTTIRKVREIDDTIRVHSDRIRMAPSFDPLRIGEGVGLNLHSIISSSGDISAQTGFAARQTIRNKILVSANKAQTLFVPATDNIYDYGWENSLNIRLSFLRFFTLDLIGEIFFPNAKVKDYMIEELSADFRVAFTRFFELSYQLQMVDRIAAGFEEAQGERFESLNTVQLRFYVNF